MSENDFDFGAEFASFGDDLKGVAYEGEHQMVVKKAVAGTSGKGKRMFTITLGFTSGPYAAKNKEVVDKLYWSPENETAARIFAQNLKVLGASQEWVMQTRPTPAQIAEQITGSVVDVRLKPDEFNGQPQTRVNYLKTVSSKAATGGAAAPSAAAAAAVSLDDPAPTAVAQQPVAAAAAAGGAASSDNPWEQ
jgi:hypothetical protein